MDEDVDLVDNKRLTPAEKIEFFDNFADEIFEDLKNLPNTEPNDDSGLHCPNPSKEYSDTLPSAVSWNCDILGLISLESTL